MGAHSVGSMSGGLSFATQLAMLEVESEQTQHRADCTIRDAAREGKREANERQAQELRDRANSMMVQAFSSGALQVASGATQFASASTRLDAGYAKLESAEIDQSLKKVADGSPMQEALLQERQFLQRQALEAEATANRLCAASSILDKSAKAVDTAFGVVGSNHDAKAAAASHSAEDAKYRADDANDAAHRKQSQLDQKLGIIQQLLDSEAETRRAILRG